MVLMWAISAHAVQKQIGRMVTRGAGRIAVRNNRADQRDRLGTSRRSLPNGSEAR